MTWHAVCVRAAAVRRVVGIAWRYCSGDDAYGRYVDCCVVRGSVPLDRGRYFAAELERRYQRGTRCC